MRLYGYFRSGTSHRVRIALNLKGLTYETVPVHLLKGEQRQESYLAVNPQGLVPTLEHDGTRIGQSLAIIEYLERIHPEPPLLPKDPAGQARVRALALICACDMHPLGNLRVLQYLKNVLGLDQEARDAWCRHWMATGFEALEARLAGEPETGRFCHGDAPTLADVCLVPQVVGAQRWGTDLGPYPTVRRIFDAGMALDAFVRAMPASQPDAA
ncbi:maleylacetoacetate isomerase [Benzoatithermus flavus]|uniref:Maleylacetoacetate isomerase n=1 Tax=Benzoatithermus flavus TaxID=3108223 RepID=A0ABU8XNI2_9PROT